MSGVYQIVDGEDTRALSEYLSQNGQLLLPMLELIEQGTMAVDDFINVLGRAALEAVLELSAQQIVGPPHRGKAGGDVRRHGRQQGTVCLSTQKIRVQKPRLRKKQGGPEAEVAIPAYEAMQDDTHLRAKLATILMSGVSTRNYARVVPEMAESCGISKSSVSREFVEASAEQLQALAERCFDGIDLLAVYIDGVRFGAHHVLAAIGVDSDGRKHVLGLREGASENAVVVTDLLTDLVSRGVSPSRRRLFVIDGSKALRAGIDAVFGADNPVQRCRNHKIENVMGYLPKELKDQVKSVMKAAYRLDPREGMAKLQQQARWLQSEYPSAAVSLLEGLEETFTINRLGLPPKLRRCLGTTNIVESPSAGVRLRTRRVTRWKDGAMVLRWAATALLTTEKHFRRIIGYQELWALKAALNEPQTQEEVAVA
ncbi:MAG TPA: IS256 family transposase [Armatimonadetes bacterium]|nr:IS256 family transposase [Armatimonadota bacterium]